MERIITYETIRRYAYVNDAVCKGPIRGIVVRFTGLGGTAIFDEDTVEGCFYGDRGILFIYPYINPWAWMNRQTVGFVDEILDVLIEKYDLKKLPVASTGGSMGGLCALVYSVYAKYTPAVCVADCPVCDAVYHFTERADLPRTMYSALWNEEGDLQTALRTISPIHLIERMPDIPYHIFHCGGDEMVDLSCHSEAFVREMKNHGHEITFDIDPGRSHCNLTYEMRMKYVNYILEALLS